MPKVITYSAYRKLLKEKKTQRQLLEKKTEQRKHASMIKCKMKEDEEFKKKAEYCTYMYCTFVRFVLLIK